MGYPTRSILSLDVSPFGRSLNLMPVMRALRSSFPQAYLGVAAHTGTCEALQALGLIDMTIPLGVVKLPVSGRAAIKRGWTLARRVRGYNFDLVLDFSPRLETQLISRLVLGAPVLSPGRLAGAFGRFLEFSGAVRSPGAPALADYSSVLRQLNAEIQDTRIGIVTSPEEDAMFEQRLHSSGSRGGEMLVLLYAANPESVRGWPVAAFGEIATRLANNFNARIVVADEPSDNSLTQRLDGWLPLGAIKLVQPRALEVFAAIARASVVITDEVAIAQIASELSTPAIEIRDSLSRMAATSSHRIVSGSSRGKVSVEEVFDVACEMIQENRSRSLFQRG
jgi:ADP-heptose:LPS heptosyltransferase